MQPTHIRHLPHVHAVGRPIFLTWRLRGSLPTGRSFPRTLTSGRAFVTMDRILDMGTTGPLHLKRPEIASMIVESIRHHQSALRHYDLHNYVVMPNHVHLLVTPRVAVSRFMHSLRRFSARQANCLLGLTGNRFWQDEYYDHLVRDDDEFRRIANYIEMNPVKAELVGTPEAYPWSSARPIDNRPQVSNLPYR